MTKWKIKRCALGVSINELLKKGGEIPLTQAEYEKLHQQIRKDVLKELSQLQAHMHWNELTIFLSNVSMNKQA
ncbi:hypothetical protein [Parageobacillus thermoglucosidasius]|uniref:Uncharacterized protein n=1 Tax=Parageobacillus thermoglucosidasius TaxID=1426 RepID=A0A1B7KUB9_PARTM|nr:hypothetical protein [Parageobacillus thermoglucosidasius]OAT73690.1 hypothetical protein A7K69_18345 [Parageobacillus thermoglucosidasius]